MQTGADLQTIGAARSREAFYENTTDTISYRSGPRLQDNGIEIFCRQTEVQPPEEGNDTSVNEPMFSNDGIDYPEGGWSAYLAIFGSFMGLIPSSGFANSMGAIEMYISENQLKIVKSSTVAWIFSLFLFVQATSTILSGAFFDRNGALIPLFVGMLLTFAGVFLTANCSKVYQFILAFGVLSGFGTGTTISPLVSVPSHYFNRKRGTYSSIASAGGNVGGIIFPVMLRKLFLEVGYAWGMRIFAFIVLFCYSFSLVFAKGRLPHKTSNKTLTKRITEYILAVDVKSFKDPQFLFLTLGCSFAELSVTATSTFFTSYARANGKSLETSYLLITITNAAGVPGRWVAGYLSDKIGRFNVIIFILTFAGILYFTILIPFSHHTAALYTFSVIYGFLTGSIFSLVPVCCGQISKTEEFGRRYSTMYFATAFSVLAGIPIGGAIIGSGSVEKYNEFMIYCAMISIASGLCYMVSRYYCIGKTLWVKF